MSAPVGVGLDGPQVNKFEQVSSLGYSTLIVVGTGIGLGGGHCTRGRAGGGHCTVRSNASWVMVTWDPSAVG